MKILVSSLVCIFLLYTVNAQEVFVTKPYVQIGKNPSPKSMQLLWHAADSPADWAVEYKRETKGNWVKSSSIQFTRVAVTGIEAHRVYHASLTELSPGNKFQYRVIKDGVIVFNSEAHAIKSVEQPYRFIAFGDIGAETPDQKKLASRAFALNPDFVVVPGDIVYENGLITDYRKKFWPVYNKDKQLDNNSPSNLTNEDFFKKGYTDASIYYKGYKGAGTGTFLPSLLISPLLGLIPAIACSSTKPKDKNLNYPNTELMKNSDYYRGYTLRAKKIKQGKVWLNWGIAFGINIAVEVILLSAH